MRRTRTASCSSIRHIFNDVYISIHITAEICCWKYFSYYLFECGKYFRIHFSKIIYIEDLLVFVCIIKMNWQTLFQALSKMKRRLLSTTWSILQPILFALKTSWICINETKAPTHTMWPQNLCYNDGKQYVIMIPFGTCMPVPA